MEDSMLDKLKTLVRKKWLLLVVILLLVLFLLMILSSFSKRELDTTPETKTDSLLRPTMSEIIPTTEFTPQELKAIEDQRKVDETVGKREVEIKTTYPWFIKLPLRGEKYFVYFDQSKVAFVGLLYPKAGDNVEEMKKEAVKRLKEDIKITDVEKYPFDWKITPE